MYTLHHVLIILPYNWKKFYLCTKQSRGS